MSNHDFVYSLEFLRDGQTLTSVRVTPDFAPVVEAARFAALRRGLPLEDAFAARGVIAPRWHATLGQPYTAGLVATAFTSSGHETSIDVPPRFFSDSARAATASLVAEGVVAAGESLTYQVAAYICGERAGSDATGLVIEDLPTSLALSDDTLDARLAGTVSEGAADATDVPVLIPRNVLDDARGLTLIDPGLETGGFLVGRVCRDRARGDIFLDVTDMLPARHTASTISTLTFTPETWWGVNAALALRNRGETCLGWVHTHPVTAMCRKRGCSQEAQRSCPMAREFFSEHDRFLHRTMFPRAHAIALVVNDWEFAPTSVSLFGYRAGLIESRGFHVV
jgi:hypothetical protein